MHLKQNSETLSTTIMDSSILNKRVRASDLARRSSEIFCKTYGDSALDAIAPFERDEIILGERVGAGSFSFVYEIKEFNLRADQSDVYTRKQVRAREAIAKSVSDGAKYVMKCLKEELEESEEDLFLDAAQDIMHEAEMLAALSHPNIVKLHGVVSTRHDAFLDGASAFFIILEGLEITLADTIENWKKQNSNSYNLPKSFKSLSSHLFKTVNKVETAATTSVDKVGSVDDRLNMPASLARVVEYLHSQGVIYHDLKTKNIGFDKEGNLKLVDFGFARFMPRHGDSYEELYEMVGAGTPRYSAPEVIFARPYNLKADVYSFAVVFWEIMCLKKPFAKYKHRKGFEKAVLKADKVLVINQRLPQSIHDIITRSLSRDITKRPMMSEVCLTFSECAFINCDFERKSTLSSTRKQPSKSHVHPVRLSSKRVLQKFGSFSSAVSATLAPKATDYGHDVSETSRTTANTTFEDYLLPRYLATHKDDK